MKKLMSIVIILLIVIICIISFAFLKYVKNNTQINENTTDSNKKIDNTLFMLDGPGYDYVPDDEFLGYDSEEWKKMIDLFYGNYYGINVNKIECSYNEDGKYTAIVDAEHDIFDEYIFDSVTGIATEINKDVSVDFVQGIEIGKTSQIQVDFSDNLCLAIGYVTNLNEEDFINEYFEGDGLLYGNLPYYDYRHPEKQGNPEYGNKFVIIPKNYDMKITVYDCYIGEDGELYTDNTLIDSISEPFIVLDDYMETSPIMCIKFEINGFEEMFPIQFNGITGELDLTGVESEVLDISMY